MHAAKMIELCDSALARLDELEALLQYVPPKRHAFVFRSKPDVAELRQIACQETDKRVTQEQAVHINQISEMLDKIYEVIPQEELDKLNDED